MARRWVTGGSVHTVTLQLAQRTVQTRRTGVFTQMSIVAWTTLTRPCHSVASAIILTDTFQLAVGTKSACRTFFITVCTSPAQTAGTVASHSVTHSAITAVTALDTVCPKPAWRTAMSTVLSSASRDAHTATSDRVILGSVSTQRHTGTVDSITPGWTSDVAACSYKSCQTFTGSSGRNAPPIIFTLALVFTVWTIATLSTYLVTFGAMETWSAVT